MDKKFIVSCDTCADMPRSWYEKNGVHYIILKRIINGNEISECFDGDEDFDNFYASLKKGDLPTTTQLNPAELREYFEKILKAEKTGDLVHLSLSSGLSNTCNNAITTAEEMNKEFEAKGSPRRVYVIDSLMGTLGIGEQVDQMVKMRDEGVETAEAIAKIEEWRTHQQGWVVMTDLFHLRRGGRIKASAAVIGALLNIRPIIHLSKQGKLPVENKVSGNIKAVKYLLSRMQKYGAEYMQKNGGDFNKSTIWVVRTSNSELYDLLLSNVRMAYPEANVRTGIVGPIIGTHLGCGGVALLFHGAPRLDIE